MCTRAASVSRLPRRGSCFASACPWSFQSTGCMLCQMKFGQNCMFDMNEERRGAILFGCAIACLHRSRNRVRAGPPGHVP